MTSAKLIIATVLLLTLAPVASLAQSALEIAPYSRAEYVEFFSAHSVSLSPEQAAECKLYVDKIRSKKKGSFADTAERIERHSITLTDMTRLLERRDASVVSGIFTSHNDPIARFFAFGLLASRGDTSTGQSLHRLLRDKTMDLHQSRMIATWAKLIGVTPDSDSQQIVDSWIHATGKQRPLKRGDQCPEFEMPTTSGEKAAISELRGRVIVLHFWATWCGPCILELPGVNRQLARYANDDVFIAYICVDSPEDEYRRLIPHIELPFHNVLDRQGSIAYQIFKMNGLPRTVVVGKTGDVVGFALTDIPRALGLEEQRGSNEEPDKAAVDGK